MFSFLLSTALLSSSLFATVYAQGVTITTPATLVTCEPASFTIAGGTAPYFLAVIPGGKPTAAALENLPNEAAAGAFTWTVNLPAGENVTMRVTDSTGVINYSDADVIQAGSDTSCVGQSASTTTGAATSSSSSTGAAGTSTSSSTSSSSSSSGAPTSGAPTTTSGAPTTANGTTSTSSAPATTTTKGAANRLSLSGGFAAAALGLVVALAA